MVEPDPLVPHGIPDRVGEDRHVAARLVDEDHVQITVGTQLAAAIAPYRHEGHAARITTRGRREKLAQPFVGGDCERAAKGVTLQVDARQQVLA